MLEALVSSRSWESAKFWTIVWIFFPLFAGFLIALFPKLSRYLTFGGAIASAAYALSRFLASTPLELRLLDHFGVGLLLDSLTGFFILTNALVTLAVVIYCWRGSQTPFFFAQVLILHGSVNAAFACADFISLYVALEVISIATFLLITYPRSDRALWVGLRYLFISNVAMLFYLVGAVLVYKAHHSFDFVGLRGAPPEAIALIFLGLLAKSGIFIAGLWLPLTHSESTSPVSALMSGVVVNAGVLAMVRCALLLPELDPLIRFFGVGTTLLGASCAIFEQDTKRMLALSTISQLGFVLAAPPVSGFYALTHGLVKSSLFLMSGVLPSRSFKELNQTPIHTPLWIALIAASFSISGFPLLSGFGAKVLTMKNLLPWQVIGMNIAALGTAIYFAKFIFLPHQTLEVGDRPKLSTGFWVAMGVLFGGLFAANIVYYEAYTFQNILKPLVTIALGWLAYWSVFRKLTVRLPRVLEEFEHLIGVMTLTLILLFLNQVLGIK